MNEQAKVDLYLLGLEIQARISELHEITFRLKDMDEEYMKNPTPENKLFLDESIDTYLKVVKKTRIQLEAYFGEEEKLGEPTDFLFRRLYKKLKEADT